MSPESSAQNHSNSKECLFFFFFFQEHSMAQVQCHLGLWLILKWKKINCRLAVNIRKHCYLVCKIIPTCPEKWYLNTGFVPRPLAWHGSTGLKMFCQMRIYSMASQGPCLLSENLRLLFVQLQLLVPFVFRHACLWDLFLHRDLSWCPHKNIVEQFFYNISLLFCYCRMFSLSFLETFIHTIFISFIQQISSQCLL